MANQAKVSRFPRIDAPEGEASFVLLHVSHTGSHPLDVKLIGTESSEAYVVSLKNNQTASLKSKNFSGTLDDWNAILSSVLLGASADDALIDGVEAVASVKDGSSITITIRKRIEGITQRLGTITLLHNEQVGEEVSLFNWCGLAIESTSSSTHELVALKTKLKDQEDEIKALKNSVGELIKAKISHENELLQKFSTLLNEKKLKIRDQQRLLASSNVDSEKLSTIEATWDLGAQAAGTSRAGKRKVDAKGSVDEDSDEGFEKMDVDVDQVPNDSEQEQADTPIEESTADEAEEEDDDTPRDLPYMKRTVNEAGAATIDREAIRTSSITAPTGVEEPPPPRTLPFAKKPTAAAPKPAANEDETASEDDDDEL